MIETALVLPFILIFLMVIVDFGLALDRREIIVHSLREAGRSAAGGDNVAAVVSRAVNESDGVLDPSDVSVCYIDENPDNPLGSVGDVAHVEINYAYSLSVGGGEMLNAAGVTFPTIPISPTAEVLLIKDTKETAPVAC